MDMEFLEYLRALILKAPALLLALTVHEFAHAWSAKKLGDPTAFFLGRTTINPLRHLDPVGTIVLFLTGMIGWAKPVPVNPLNFSRPSRDMMLTAVAGPGANIALSVLSAFVYKAMGAVELTHSTIAIMAPLLFMAKASVIINIALSVFNLIPIPPLDGSKVLMHFLPPDKALKFSRIEPYGFLILIALIFTGVAGAVVSPVVTFAYDILINGVL
jgi:Zn-dependent protease